MQPKDKVEQFKASLQAKKENDLRAAQARQEGGLSAGQEELYQQKIAELESDLAKAEEGAKGWEQKARELQEVYARLLAENDNFRKRVAREKEDSVRYGYEKLVRELLPVLDGLEKALEHGTQTPEKQAILDGVQLVLKQFHKALEGVGVRRVQAVGEPFDPNFHEAMGHSESDEHEPDTVVQEYRTGYQFHDRLLRPALVTVAKPPSDKK